MNSKSGLYRPKRTLAPLKCMDPTFIFTDHVALEWQKDLHISGLQSQVKPYSPLVWAPTSTPQYSSIAGLIVFIRWYFGVS